MNANNNDSNVVPTKSLFAPISNSLNSCLSNVSNKINSGLIPSNNPQLNALGSYDTFITPEMQITSMAINNLYSNYLIDIATGKRNYNQNDLSSSHINKHSLSPIKIMIQSPNKLISLRREQEIMNLKAENHSFRIFRETRKRFRSLSKEIDKRTKDSFGMNKKCFEYMQYQMPLPPCNSLNLNSKAATVIRLPKIRTYHKAGLSNDFINSINYNNSKTNTNKSLLLGKELGALFNNNKGNLSENSVRQSSQNNNVSCMVVNSNNNYNNSGTFENEGNSTTIERSHNRGTMKKNSSTFF